MKRRITTRKIAYEIGEFRELLRPAQPRKYPPGKMTRGPRLNGKKRWMVANRARAMRAFGLKPDIKQITFEYFG